MVGLGTFTKKRSVTIEVTNLDETYKDEKLKGLIQRLVGLKIEEVRLCYYSYHEHGIPSGPPWGETFYVFTVAQTIEALENANRPTDGWDAIDQTLDVELQSRVCREV